MNFSKYFSALLLAGTMILSLLNATSAQIISTVAGNGTYAISNDGGLATGSTLSGPRGVVLDGAGNIYLSEYGYSRIRKVDYATGIISTIAGTGTNGFSGDGGLATSAQIYGPAGMFIDAIGDIYFADKNNERIRKISAATGIISTVAGNGTQSFGGDGGPATSAQLFQPEGVAVDASGNIYIADEFNARIRKVNVATGIIGTIAGSGSISFSGDGGSAASANLNYPSGVAVDNVGDVYIVDKSNYRIRKISSGTGIINTIAGVGGGGYSGDGGPASAADFYNPHGIFIDMSGVIYIAESGNQVVRKIDLSGNISTVAGNGSFGYTGNGSVATSAQLSGPSAVFVDPLGNIFIAEENNSVIRKVSIASAPVASFTSSSPTCFGTPTVFSNTSTGGTSFNWDFGNGNVSTLQNPSQSYSSAGTFNVQLIVTDAAGSDTAFGTVTIQQAPNVNAGGNMAICEGTPNVILNGSVSGGATGGIWTSSGTGIFSPNNTSLNAIYIVSNSDIVSGSVTFTLTSSGNGVCAAVTDNTLVTINSNPSISLSKTFPNCTLYDGMLVANITGGTPPYNYSWSNQINTVGSNNDTLSSINTNMYSLYVADANSCTKDSIFISLTFAGVMPILNGTVNLNSNPITSGRVQLFAIDSNQIPKALAVDFVDGTGNYSFINIQLGTYLVRAIADSSIYPNSIPTYAGNEFRWDSSDFWVASCNSSDIFNINVIDLTPSVIAGATIGGIIWDDSDTTMGNRGIRKPGEPIKGVGVIIQRRPGGNASMRTTSDTITGHYQFDNVDTGSYDIYIEMPSGVMLNTYAIDVNTTSDVFINNDFYVDSTSGKIDTTNRNNVDSVFATKIVTTIGAEKFSINIFPVPLSENSILLINSENQSSVTILIEDQIGRSISDVKNISLNKGENKIQINGIAKFGLGLYFIKIKGETLNSTIRVVKQL